MVSSFFFRSVITCLATLFIKVYVWPWLIWGKQRQAQFDDVAGPDCASEIEGGVWEQRSVFELIEQGLQECPNGLAVVCMFQPATHLADLADETAKTIEASANGTPNGLNGFTKKSTSDAALWRKDDGQNGILEPRHHNKAIELSSYATRQYLTLTYQELHNTALRLATGLLANGARANTAMVMAIPNCAEYAILLWACILARITYVSLDPALLEISGFTELKHTLRALKPQILVAPTAVSGKALDVAIAELQLASPIRICLGRAETAGWRSLSNIIKQGGDRAAAEEHAMMAAAREDRPGRIHSVMFTSGTSGGQPKGCPQRVSGMAHALQSQAWLIGKGARALMQPHNSRGIAPAQTLQTWSAGGTVVLTGQAFNANEALDAIARVHATFLVLTPPMVHEMTEVRRARSDVDVACVSTVQVGGDTITRGMLERCALLFPQARVCVNHGMTEGPGAFVWPFSRQHAPVFYGGEVCPAGAVAPGATVRIMDGEKVLDRGRPGELHVACPSIIKHYWGGRSEEESFYEDKRGKRWFRTGDFATADRDGLIYVLGRMKNIIRRAGVPVMPAVIESLIEAYTGAQVSETENPVAFASLYAKLTM
jgi:acyl-CoA synthetase (AMP-forming)/AMP-acid ligase II